MSCKFFLVSCLCGFVALAGFSGCTRKAAQLDVAPPEYVPPPVEEYVAPPEPVVVEDHKTVLVPVYFDFDRYNLRSDAVSVVQNAARYLSENMNMQVTLEGHADERGTDEYNMGLAENRAKAVRDYLVNYGISRNRVDVVSYGKSRLASYNCGDEECHGLNRRVEWRVR